MAERGLLLVFTKPVEGREAEYNEWYDAVHLRDVGMIAGVASARRYEIASPEHAGAESPHRYLAIYEIDVDPQLVIGELQTRYGTDRMTASPALDTSATVMSVWTPHSSLVAAAPHSRHHSDLSDPQLLRLSEVLCRLGATVAFSASEALSAALAAGVVNTTADIGSSIDDLEDAGLLQQVQKNPPRWKAVHTGG